MTISQNATPLVFSDTSGGLATTLVSGAHNMPAGKLATVAVKWETATAVTSVTDTAGNTYTACTPADDTTRGQHSQVFYCLNTTANAANIITVMWPALSAQYLTATLEISNFTGSASLAAQTQTTGGSGTAVTTASFTAGGFAVAAISDFAGANTAPGTGWTETSDVAAGGGHTLSRYDTPGGSYVADATLSTGAFWTIAAASFSESGGGGPNITSTSAANPINGSTLTITGTAFGATQGAGSVTIGGIAQTVTSWADTSINVTVARGTNKFGAALNIVVTDNALTASSAYSLASIQPIAGWSFVNLTTPNTTASFRLTSTPDLASGDQIAWNTVANGVSVAVDATFSATSSVLSFDFEVWSAGSGWGAIATQIVIGADKVTKTSRHKASSTQERTPGGMFGSQAATTPAGLFDSFMVLPVTSGGNVTLALTGNGSTGSVGTLTPNTSIGTTGNAGNGGTGNVGAAQSLTGVAATSAVGTVAPGNSKALTGNAGTGSVGAVAPSTVIALTGVAGAGAAGTLSAAGSLALSGNAGTGAIGTVLPASAVPLTGNAGMGANGAVSPSQAGTVGLTGVEGAGQVGTLTPSTTVAITGNVSTGAVGSVVGGASLALTGNTSAGSVGAVSPASAIPLTAAQATGQVGTVSVQSSDVTVALTGVSATGQVGSVAAVGGDAAASGVLGFEMGGQPQQKRRNLVYVVEDETPRSSAPTPPQAADAKKAKDKAAEIIKAAAIEHAAQITTKAVRYANVRTALKPLGLGNWNWINLYQRMYEQALADQLRQELALEDQINEEEAALILLLLEL